MALERLWTGGLQERRLIKAHAKPLPIGGDIAQPGGCRRFRRLVIVAATSGPAKSRKQEKFRVAPLALDQACVVSIGRMSRIESTSRTKP